HNKRSYDPLGTTVVVSNIFVGNNISRQSNAPSARQYPDTSRSMGVKIHLHPAGGVESSRCCRDPIFTAILAQTTITLGQERMCHDSHRRRVERDVQDNRTRY